MQLSMPWWVDSHREVSWIISTCRWQRETLVHSSNVGCIDCVKSSWEWWPETMDAHRCCGLEVETSSWVGGSPLHEYCSNAILHCCGKTTISDEYVLKEVCCIKMQRKVCGYGILSSMLKAPKYPPQSTARCNSKDPLTHDWFRPDPAREPPSEQTWMHDSSGGDEDISGIAFKQVLYPFLLIVVWIMDCWLEKKEAGIDVAGLFVAASLRAAEALKDKEGLFFRGQSSEICPSTSKEQHGLFLALGEANRRTVFRKTMSYGEPEFQNSCNQPGWVWEYAIWRRRRWRRCDKAKGTARNSRI